MAHSHWSRPRPGRVQEPNVHSGPRQGQGPIPIAFYCASPVPWTNPGPIPCSVNIPLKF